MRFLGTLGLALGVLLLGAPQAWADKWDFTTNGDATAAATNNELIHGSQQEHDFAGPGGTADQDQDWYIIRSEARSSYEVSISGGGSDAAVSLYRFASDGTTSLQSGSDAGGVGYAGFLRWAEDTTAENQFIKVTGYDTVSKNSNDAYTIRSYETTIAVPRYNNTSGQVTVLICQNPSPFTVTGTAYLWNESNGAAVTSLTLSLTTQDIDTFNLSTVNSGAANNTKGGITIAHNGGYGGLVCKAVALEPATGFSFDSPGVVKPR